MPRTKSATIHHIDTKEAKSLSWNLGDPSPSSSFSSTSSSSSSLNEKQNEFELIDLDDDDVIYKPPPFKKPRKTYYKNQRHRRRRRRRCHNNRDDEIYAHVLSEELQQLIKEHDFYVNIKWKTNIQTDCDQFACVLGRIELILDERRVTNVLPDTQEFWLYVNEDDERKSFIYFEWNNNNNDDDEELTKSSSDLKFEFFTLEKSPPVAVLSALSTKNTFVLLAQEFDTSTRKISACVMLKSCAVVQLRFASEAPSLKPNVIIQTAMHYLCNVLPPDYTGKRRVRKHDIDALYSAVKKLRREEKKEKKQEEEEEKEEEEGEIYVQHRYLVPRLRTYQVDAVVWMLRQERRGINDEHVDEELHELYQEIRTLDNKTFYYNRFGGCLVKNKPKRTVWNAGGILADEMGLGKTVEVLACVLCNPRKGDETKTCVEEDEEEEEEEEDKTISSISLEDESEMQEMDSRERCDAKNVFASAPHFECICGATEKKIGSKNQVQCYDCGIWQHAKCVRYKSDSSRYFCPHCWVAKDPVASRATLIVCPTAICHQWLDEISRHVRKKSLKVYEYVGVSKIGFVQPPTVADNDIVITTYEILRKELQYVDLPHSNSETGRRLRHPKRFMALPSPLVAIQWWRICLDEAQMVESVATKIAEMVSRLEAVNRWCITGTPIQKSIEDIYGLLVFLGADPYSIRAWWHECLYEPYCYGDTEPMHQILGRFLWRTAKMDVLDQIGLPEQTQEIHWLRFTPVEEHFYRLLHGQCSRDAMATFNTITDLEIKLSSIDRKTLTKLLAPLLRLRQACCHPQAVRGQFMSLQKNMMTMDELLTSLIKKTKIEAEEAQRQHIAALNGLAGLHIIQEEWIEAIEKYRDVLRMADEHDATIKTDRMQRLHALHNLAELLESGHVDVAPTIRDSSLRSEIRTLRTDYLVKCASKVERAQETLKTCQQTVRDLQKQLRSSNADWWVETILAVEKRNIEEELTERIRSDLLLVAQPGRLSVVNSVRHLTGLQFVIFNQLEALSKAHDALSKAVVGMEPHPDQAAVNAAVDCHLRPSDKKRLKCVYCRVHELFNTYEGRLFSFADKNDEKSDDEEKIEEENNENDLVRQLRRGTWADSEIERILKVMNTFARSHNICDLEESATHLKLFEARKKEFRALRGVWMEIRDSASAIDELNMATIRLRLRFPDEPKADPPQANILESSEISHHRLKLISDQVVATNEKKKKLGQLLYLQNLSKLDYNKGINPEPCPICQKVLGAQWSVLQCGHCYCVECIRVLVSQCTCRGKFLSMKCPVCRQKTAAGEISYVQTKEEEKVEGSLSTKVEAIVKTLLNIHLQQPKAKVLVFSTWQDVLDVIENALKINNITFCNLKTHSKFQDNLNEFKKNGNVKALLLPVHSGANGLNLIEATHLLLVEPILNPASELQAIGRIHRIGQTRPTVVHRFLVKNTIEERMNEMLKSHCITQSSHESEENTLTIHDLRNLFVEDENGREHDFHE